VRVVQLEQVLHEGGAAAPTSLALAIDDDDRGLAERRQVPVEVCCFVPCP
jgi:hypothetical protein